MHDVVKLNTLKFNFDTFYIIILLYNNILNVQLPTLIYLFYFYLFNEYLFFYLKLIK